MFAEVVEKTILQRRIGHDKYLMMEQVKGYSLNGKIVGKVWTGTSW